MTDEHQPRERAVPCQKCRKMTWNVEAICDDCAFDDLGERRKYHQYLAAIRGLGLIQLRRSELVSTDE